jgi:phage FluMu protein Com
MDINLEFLPEYRCQTCNKLLCKGFLEGAQSALEVKCRGCGRICLFRGKDAAIIMERSVLIRQGLILDTDTN